MCRLYLFDLFFSCFEWLIAATAMEFFFRRSLTGGKVPSFLLLLLVCPSRFDVIQEHLIVLAMIYC